MTPRVIQPSSLQELTYEIEGGDDQPDFKFGRGTDIKVASVDFGETIPESSPSPNPRADGIRFGRDYYRGRTITFEGNIYTARSQPGEQLAALLTGEAFQSAWSPEQLRLTPGRVTALRMHRAGRIRRVYGRPGRFLPTSGRTKRGWMPFTCTFECVDHLYYDDVELAEVVPLIPDSIGGLEGELIGPIIASSAGQGSNTLLVGGTKPAWLGYKIYGPIIDPSIQITGRWRATLQMTLAYDEFVVVEPTPWQRTVRRNSGANASGVFTAQSARLSEMRVYPGANEVLLRGNDPTGTARIETFWRDTYSLF